MLRASLKPRARGPGARTDRPAALPPPPGRAGLPPRGATLPHIWPLLVTTTLAEATPVAARRGGMARARGASTWRGVEHHP